MKKIKCNGYPLFLINSPQSLLDFMECKIDDILLHMCNAGKYHVHSVISLLFLKGP